MLSGRRRTRHYRNAGGRPSCGSCMLPGGAGPGNAASTLRERKQCHQTSTTKVDQPGFLRATQLADPGLPCSLQVPGPRDRAYRQRMRPRSLTPSDPSGRWRQHSGVVAPVYHGNSVRHVGTNPAPCMAGTSTGISAWQQRPPLLFNHMCIQ